MKIKNISILGTGTMGHGITLSSAMSGLNATMYGRTDASLERGFNAINQDLNRLEEQGELNHGDFKDILSRIRGVKTVEEAAENADFIIESLAEDLNIKRDFFQKLDELCSADVILATNTSGLSPTKIAEVTVHPERVVVAHFWNPPQLIPLVEIVPGERTSKDTVLKTKELIEFIGKKAVCMEKECAGFIGNRLQLALLREAMYIVEQGWAKPEEVDKAMEYGHGRRLPVTGPLMSADMGGLDIFYNISSYLFKELCDYKEPFKLMKEKIEKGDLGSKKGKGFYKWSKEDLEKKQKERTQLLLYFLKKDND